MSASCPSVQVPPAPVARSTVCCSSQESAKFTAAARMQAAMANARVARVNCRRRASVSRSGFVGFVFFFIGKLLPKSGQAGVLRPVLL